MQVSTECPDCRLKYNVTVKAGAIAKAVIKTTIEADKGYITALTLAEHISAMCKTLEDVAESLGGKVSVGINNMHKKGNKYSIEFLVLEVKGSDQ